MKNAPWTALAVTAILLLATGCVVVLGKDETGIGEASDSFASHVDATYSSDSDSESDPGSSAGHPDIVPVERTVIGSEVNIGPFSDGIRCGAFLFLSGQIAIDSSGNVLSGDIRRSTHLVLTRIGEMLGKANLGYEDVVKATVFLRSIDDYAAMNEVYKEYFPVAPPARSCVEVSGLARNADVEIEVIAYRP